MKIAVFGSTGGNGRLVITEGIRRGLARSAFATALVDLAQDRGAGRQIVNITG